MRSQTRRLLTAVALTASVAVALAGCDKKTTASADDMSLGNPAAKVTVVEYASASCSHCALWNNDVFPQLKSRFIDTGKIRYVFREFLTAPTQFAAAGYLLARRVGQARYFEVTDAIFRQQEVIFASEDLWGGLLKIAKTFGLTEEQFTAALNDKAALAAINARVAKATERDQIEVTPTFFVNGVRAEGGQSIEALAAAIDKAASGKAAPGKPVKG
jgi:protein-disulfide isomerase